MKKQPGDYRRPPFYRRWPFKKQEISEENRRNYEYVNQLIASGYNPRNDPSSPYYSKLENRKPYVKPDYGDTKYSLVETAPYLKGREKMEERLNSADGLADLDYVIMTLLRGYALPKSYNDHKLKGEQKGKRECHLHGYRNDWVLVYQYDDKELILYALNTGTHKECGVD